MEIITNVLCIKDTIGFKKGEVFKAIFGVFKKYDGISRIKIKYKEYPEYFQEILEEKKYNLLFNV